MTEIQKPRGFKSMGAAVVAGASVLGLVLGTGTASAAVDSSNSVVDANGNLITVTLSDTFINSVAPLDGNPLTREWFANGVAGWEVTGPDADDFEGTVKIGYQVGYPMSLGGSLSIDWASPSITAGAGINAGIGDTTTRTTVPVLTEPEDIFDENGDPVLDSEGNPTQTEGGEPVIGTDGRPVTRDIYASSGEATNGATAGINASADLIPTASGNITLEPGPGIVQSEGAEAVIDGDVSITGVEADGTGPSGSIQVANLHGTATGILGNVRVRPYVAVISSTGDSVVTYGQPWTFN